MAATYPFQMDHYIQNTLSVDTRRQSSWLDDDESSILDENILDNNNLLDSSHDMSPIDRRRTSILDSSSAMYSPSNEWDFEDHEMSLSAGPADDNSPVPAATFEHSSGTNNPFTRLEQQAQPAYAQQNNSWSSSHGASGSCTPTVYDNNAFPSTGFEESSYMVSGIGGAGPAGAFGSEVHITPHATVFQGAGASIPSTPAQKDWAQASGAEAHDSQPMQKRMRPHSPGPRSHSPLHVMRRDGIRKKNARFDIPAERTLMNIDQLIARSQDDNEIKELKQQKRLLRNRQAALDSRQRKKLHTERLEEEKKIHSAVIQDLEDKLNAMSMQEEQMHRRLETVIHERDFIARKADNLQMEKEDLVRSHTIESGELRKKNTFLQDQVQKLQDVLERGPVQHAQNPSGFSDPFTLDSDFDLEGDYWNDHMSMQTNDVVPIKTEKIQPLGEAEKPVAAPGLLLILLLCGAFVASSKSAVQSLPPLPKQLQTASANVLNNIFHDAGVTPMEANRVEVSEASSTSDTWVVAKSSVPQMVGLGSSLAMLNSQLDKPTAEQQHEAFLQMTPAEYDDVTSNAYHRDPEPAARNRRHIAESLASMRSNKPTAADVYTRSLLWDKVDAEVVRRFAAFAQRAQQQAQQAPCGDREAGGYGDSAV